MPPTIYISAAHKSSGKTTISIGLCAALQTRGLNVQPFKKGPDYIDPLWLGLAAGNDCHNLDFFTMTKAEISQDFNDYSKTADIALIEGNKGLYDGLDLKGANSNAALAIYLNTPVILVLDTRGMTRGIAPLILGYQQFEQEINIAGVILNSVGGSRHESKLRNVIEHYTDVNVLGAVPRHSNLNIEERHLGLMPSNEKADAQQRINAIKKAILAGVDLDKVIDSAKQSITPCQTVPNQRKSVIIETCRIGIAQDPAFGFYYKADLQVFKNLGATLVPFNTLKDKTLPDVDALFIGGGFPEVWMTELAKNKILQIQIKQFIEAGHPAYAECGGLMYLCKQISWQGQTYPMVGVIDGNIIMHKKPQGRGYVRLKQNKESLWQNNSEIEIAAHEFHYSELTNLPKNSQFAYQVKRGYGIDGQHDGLIYKNLLANYTHFKNTENNQWIHRFIQFILKYQSQKTIL